MGFIRFFLYFLIAMMVVRALRQWWQQGEAPRGRVPPPPPPRAGQPSPYEVLGIAPGASQREIRKAYQKLVQQYHPDQVAHLGTELREVAERRTKEITAAYNQIKRGD